MTIIPLQDQECCSSDRKVLPDETAMSLVWKRRRIDPQSGRALELLGHAIDYLADEILRDGGLVTENDERIEAMEILKALNRRVYFQCPEAPTLRERLHALFLSFLERASAVRQAQKPSSGNPEI